MQEYVLDQGIIIDDVEGVINGIKSISKVSFTGIEVIKKFVTTQKAVYFFLDDRANVRLVQDRNTVYLWVDTGLTDQYGNPIFISLLKNSDGFSGHFYGTAKALGSNISSYFPKNRKQISENISAFRSKYDSKVSVRALKHIESEEGFFLSSCNGDAMPQTEFARKIESLHLVLPEEVPELLEEPEPEATPEEENPLVNWSASEREITLSILLEKIDELQAYIKELLSTIEEMSSTSNIKIDELQKKNAEYEIALKQIRTFMSDEAENAKERSGKTDNRVTLGHDLIARKGKILVLGATEISINDMRGIVKNYGFEKNDFDFETDYSRVVSFSGRITNEGRYCAIIFGACPHKAQDSYGYSSLVEKYKQMKDGPLAADARSTSGKLKVTKDSFKRAIQEICSKLENLEVV